MRCLRTFRKARFSALSRPAPRSRTRNSGVARIAGVSTGKDRTTAGWRVGFGNSGPVRRRLPGEPTGSGYRLAPRPNQLGRDHYDVPNSSRLFKEADDSEAWSTSVFLNAVAA